MQALKSTAPLGEVVPTVALYDTKVGIIHATPPVTPSSPASDAPPRSPSPLRSEAASDDPGVEVQMSTFGQPVVEEEEEEAEDNERSWRR